MTPPQKLSPYNVTHYSRPTVLNIHLTSTCPIWFTVDVFDFGDFVMHNQNLVARVCLLSVEATSECA